MTDDELGFLRAAAANPADDLAWLVYADWLEERSDAVSAARGEFVRLQVWRATTPTTDPMWQTILDEERVLLARHGRKWNGGIHRWLHRHGLPEKVDARRGPIRGWRYTRGMVGTVAAELSAVIARPNWVFDLGPVRRLRLCGPRYPSEAIPSLIGRLLVVDLHRDGGSLAHWEGLMRALAPVPVLHFRGDHVWPRQIASLDRLITAGRCSPVVLYRQSTATSDWAILDPFGKWPALRAEVENLMEVPLPAAPSQTRS